MAFIDENIPTPTGTTCL